MLNPDADVLARLDRIDSREAIRALCAKYALAIDARDLDLLMSVFPEDVQVGRDRVGRAALKEHFDHVLRDRFTQTAHIIANHLIEFDDPDHAKGVLYCRAEHEMDGRFVVVQMQYWDRYERIEGRWFFRRRLPLFWYCTDVLEAPVGEHKIRWPDREPVDGGLPGFWPSWDDFWANPPDGDWTVGASPPEGEFLAALRRGVPPT